MKVTIENHSGRLRLRWRYQGQRYTMGCGVPATPTGKAVARQKAAEIEKDLACGYFDDTLLRYKPRILGKTATELSCPELFQRFTKAMEREKGLSPGTLCKYSGVQAHLLKRLDIPAHQVSEQLARNFAAQLMEQCSSSTAKTYLWLLQSCFTWAKGMYHVPPENPWTGLAARVKPQPRQGVKPFTQAEIRAILAAFRGDRHYWHYGDFVAFLFGTGCRFGEAAGLQWQHVADDFKTVWIGESVSRSHRKSTKTGKARTLVLPEKVSEMLTDRRQAKAIGRNAKPTDLVFPSPKGLPINDHTFRARAWKSVLERCHIEYRKPYCTRHSAISHALANGANPIALAEQTGHDKRVLLSTYAHCVESKSLFLEF